MSWSMNAASFSIRLSSELKNSAGESLDVVTHIKSGASIFDRRV